MPNNYKYDTWEDAIDDAIGSAINDNVTVPFNDDSMPSALLDDDFDTAVKEAIKNIKAIKGLTITFKWEK